MSQLEDARSGCAQPMPGHAVTRPLEQELQSLGLSSFRGLAKYALELVVIWATYFILAKIGSVLAFINPSAMPVWLPLVLPWLPSSCAGCVFGRRYSRQY